MRFLRKFNEAIHGDFFQDVYDSDTSSNEPSINLESIIAVIDDINAYVNNLSEEDWDQREDEIYQYKKNKIMTLTYEEREAILDNADGVPGIDSDWVYDIIEDINISEREDRELMEDREYDLNTCIEVFLQRMIRSGYFDNNSKVEVDGKFFFKNDDDDNDQDEIKYEAIFELRGDTSLKEAKVEKSKTTFTTAFRNFCQGNLDSIYDHPIDKDGTVQIGGKNFIYSIIIQKAI